MKKIVVFTMSVLFGALVFANGTDGSLTGSSSVVVLNSNGSNLFNVIYRAKDRGNVKVSIINDQHDVVFSETLKKIGGFLRPYNFKDLPEGAYTIEIEDAFGKKIERVNFGSEKVLPLIHLAKLTAEHDKYMLSGRSEIPDNISVAIYDDAHQLIYEESRKVQGEFGEVFNLKNIPGAFTIEVSDNQGMLKSIQR